MYKQTIKNPSAYVTVGKQRIKQHDLTTSGSLIGTNEGTVYLSDNTEFEIELFNPLRTKVVAEISLNGTKLTGGIVLRPGDRVYLDRHISENKKFLFSTYSVGNSQEVIDAIANNGLLEVSFYKEKEFNYDGWRRTWDSNPWHDGRIYFDGPTYGPQITPNSFNVSNTNFVSPQTLNGALNSNNVLMGNGGHTPIASVSNYSYDSFDPSSVLRSGIKKSKSIETGRIEKGSTSDQKFKTVDIDLEGLPTNIFKWKLLPKSTELVYKEDIVSYCGECGSKKKKESHKFCPHCGNKF